MGVLEGSRYLCRCHLCLEGALSTRGGQRGAGSLSFPAASICQPITAELAAFHFQLPTSASQLMQVALFFLPLEAAASPLPAPPASVGRLVKAAWCTPGIRFPSSRLLWVSSLSPCLFHFSSCCCWQAVALAEAGRDQAVLPGRQLPASQHPREGTTRLLPSIHPLWQSCLLIRSRCLQAQWCHMGGTGKPK